MAGRIDLAVGWSTTSWCGLSGFVPSEIRPVVGCAQRRACLRKRQGLCCASRPEHFRARRPLRAALAVWVESRREIRPPAVRPPSFLSICPLLVDCPSYPTRHAGAWNPGPRRSRPVSLVRFLSAPCSPHDVRQDRLLKSPRSTRADGNFSSASRSDERDPSVR